MKFLIALFDFLCGTEVLIYKGFAFIDHVTGHPIGYYRDKKGHLWLAEGARSRCRVRVDK